MNERNFRRLIDWQVKMRREGRYYSMRVHQKQLGGIDWSRRDSTGRLRMGPDGYLPRVEQ